jgi:Flp pilus assembly protein TadB
MLSERERQVLEQIEQRLAESDPKLAAKLTRGMRLAMLRRWMFVCLGWLLVIAMAVAGWWIIAVLLIGPLMALTLARLILAAHRRRHPWDW